MFPRPLGGQSLKGSPESVDRQYRVAMEHGFTFLETPAQVERYVRAGHLVRVKPSPDLDLAEVSFPFARPEVATFLQRLSAQYRRACGERLVVTSLTRPQNRQPWNASSLSVHPTGMAVDIRRSGSAACRRWLEETLLSLERAGVLDATLERNPPHYHVAVFPRPYARYVEALQGSRSQVRVASAEGLPYQVRRGDTLWTIARKHGVTVEELKARNNLKDSRIFVGQILTVPMAQ